MIVCNDLAGLTSQKKDCKPYKQIDAHINLRSSAELRVRGWAWERGLVEGLGTRSGGGPGNEVRGRAWEQGPVEGLGARLRFSHCIAYITPGAFEHYDAVLHCTQKLLITQTSTNYHCSSALPQDIEPHVVSIDRRKSVSELIAAMSEVRVHGIVE